jgi:hypothetical protein
MSAFDEFGYPPSLANEAALGAASTFPFAFRAVGNQLWWSNGTAWVQLDAAPPAGGNVVVAATPAGGTINDYAPAGFATATHILLAPTGTPNILAITGLAGGAAHTAKTIINNSADYLIILPREHTDSAAANRFSMQSTVFVMPGNSVQVVYDTIASRWLVHASQQESAARFFLREDFTARVTSGTNGITGLMASSATGTGAAVAMVTPTANAHGVVSLSTGTVATGNAGVYDGSVASHSGASMGPAFSLSRIQVGVALSTAAERFRMSAGWVTSGTSECTDGVYWDYSDADSANWQLVNANNNVRTKTVSGLVANISQYAWLGTWCNSSWGRADGFYSLDGNSWTLVTGASTNLPGTARQFNLGIKFAKSVGVTTRTGFADLIEGRYLSNSRS